MSSSSPARRFAALAGIAIAVTVAVNPPILLVVPVVFAVIVPFEKLFPRHPQQLRRPEVGTDIAYALLAAPLGAIGLGVAVVIAVVSLAWIPGLLMRPLITALPTPVTAIAGLLLFDLVVYWGHRAAHEIPFLWRFHSIHHSIRHLDWISPFRAHPLDGLAVAPAFGLLIVAGFSPELTGILAVLRGVSAVFIHANVRWRLRPLHKLIITPEYHHWHHANEPEAHHSNYSTFLPIWDLAFGTYFMPSDRRPMTYGVDEFVPVGVARQLAHPFRRRPAMTNAAGR